MTVSSTLNRISYDGNSVTVAFAVSFPFQAKADLVVLSTVISTGVQTTKALTTDYTISGSTDTLGFYSSGGTVTFLVAPASTVRITIYRDPARTQGLDLVASDSLPAESTEAAIDYQTMLIQRVYDLISRSLRQPDGDSANIATIPSKVDRASLFLAFDSDGNPVAIQAFTSNPGATTVTAFMATVLDDTTALQARATLGASQIEPTDITFKITGSQDQTKKLRFEVDGITAATTRVWTIQDSDDTVVGRATTDTLTNKTLTGPLISQVVFPATQVPSAGANTLDDYEEGVFTPSLGGNATYTNRGGTYTKIGRIVHVAGYIVVNVLGTGSDKTMIGLPFAAVGLDVNWTYPVTVGLYALLAINRTAMFGSINVNAAPTSITFFGPAAAAATNDPGTAIFGNGTTMYFHCTYEAAT